MTNFKLATRNNRNFTTTTKYYTNQDENSKLNKNEELFVLDPDIKTSSHLANEESQSSEKLFSLLKVNKQESLDNCHSADLSMNEAEHVCGKASHLFTRNKSSLPEQQRKETESILNQRVVGNPDLNHNTEEEICIYNIDRYLKRLMGAMLRAKSVQEVLPNPQATNDVVSNAEYLIKELNTLSHNIQTLTDNNDKIRAELRNRKISLIEEQLTTFMDLPGNIDDNID